jgi:Amt family ammonium transporter
VASSAGCALETPLAGAVTGLLAGALVVFAVELFELRLSVDDPAGAVSVHAVGGIWGLLSAGLFAHTPGSGQFVAQLVGVATLIGFVLPMTFGLNSLLNHFWPWRVSPQGERDGLDLHELGAGAYPEFVTHRDEYGPR